MRGDQSTVAERNPKSTESLVYPFGRCAQYLRGSCRSRTRYLSRLGTSSQEERERVVIEQERLDQEQEQLATVHEAAALQVRSTMSKKRCRTTYASDENRLNQLHKRYLLRRKEIEDSEDLDLKARADAYATLLEGLRLYMTLAVHLKSYHSFFKGSTLLDQENFKFEVSTRTRLIISQAEAIKRAIDGKDPVPDELTSYPEELKVYLRAIRICRDIIPKLKYKDADEKPMDSKRPQSQRLSRGVAITRKPAADLGVDDIFE
ncbi:hypothetical protein GMRT_11668 [Giardia muris]|uniref:Uncharacterized protein n=1 Tax=Giardia muris TaxID=5742 RepID=A0A4Z1T1G5_GIAMU|nr:hypothetical protein GMRT_11668 [Giardia muris]|eukprot:TNJ29538.1 hypothetical protein GMRT_11668 [Giardia muris]